MKWITRERAKVDRVACPWLIKKFVDPSAEFYFVPADGVMSEAARLNATPFDVEGVELGHHGRECTFDAILKSIGLMTIPRSDCWAKLSTGRTRTTRYGNNPRARVWKRSRRAFAISDSKTITR